MPRRAPGEAVRGAHGTVWYVNRNRRSITLIEDEEGLTGVVLGTATYASPHWSGWDPYAYTEYWVTVVPCPVRVRKYVREEDRA